jgi:hypothetical protein
LNIIISQPIIKTTIQKIIRIIHAQINNGMLASTSQMAGIKNPAFYKQNHYY